MVSKEQPGDLLKGLSPFQRPALELNNFKRSPFEVLSNCKAPPILSTPAEWFSYKYAEQTQQYGCPFLEYRVALIEGGESLSPIDINLDFFAAILKGDPRLGHSVIYYEPELQFYFYDPIDQLYKTTTSEKLQCLVRALLLKCAQEMSRLVDPLNLFARFRSDKVTTAIIQRAKAILAVEESFFSATSPHKRKEGPELPERLARVFIESMLEKRPGSILTVTQAYALFCNLSQQKNLQPLKRSDFKQMMAELMKNTFGISLRRDIENNEGKQQEGWKNVGTAQSEEVQALVA